MSSYTKNLNLLKKDPVADGADTFNIDTMLNENWDKLDVASGRKADLGEDGKVVPAQMPEMNYEAPLKSAAAKETPVDADSLTLVDSADKGGTKRVLWSRIKAVLKEAFDAVYAAKTHTHGAGDMTSGILAVARGGTGKGIWEGNRLLYPSAADLLEQLPFPAAAGSVLRQGTSGAPYWTGLSDLVSALGLSGAAKIATGSYTGTGTYGSSNPCSLTFPFSPKFVLIFQRSGTSWRHMGFFVSGGTRYLTMYFGKGQNGNCSSYEESVFSLTSSILSWYSGWDNSQLNEESSQYSYIALR